MSDIKELKYERMLAIQRELTNKYDYKWIKCVDILIKQFILEHPNIEFPYDVSKISEDCVKLRKEYDEIKNEIIDFYPFLQEN